MMGWTLGRYFFLRHMAITAWFFLGVSALVFLIDFSEFASRASGLPGFTVGIAFAVSSLRAPMIIQQTVPFIGLFAAMATLISLNRKYELVIARSAGISAWQFLVPACAGAFVFGVLVVTVLNPLAAYGFARSETIEAELKSDKSISVAPFAAPWLRQRTREGETIIGARAILSQGAELVDAVFFRLSRDGEIVERLDADRAYLRDGYWELWNAKPFRESGHLDPIETVKVPTSLRPEFVQERLSRPETIPFFSLPGKLEVARSFGLRASAFSTHFHSLLALPALLVAMTLIAATVSMRFARMGQSATMILGGIIAGFLLYVVTVLVKAFGNAGLMPAPVAAWLPVAVAMFFGVTFLLYKEDG